MQAPNHAGKKKMTNWLKEKAGRGEKKTDQEQKTRLPISSVIKKEKRDMKSLFEVNIV